ncbi:MAG: NADP-dependent malic enzyme [Candidatus Caenarcaniphilales bacterium]|nr:NADP-dependent malic enzyme [Candidatus Caenarcaniphilales bacterium]
MELSEQDKKIFEAHQGGKITIDSTPVRNMDELAVVYTPGVAKVCTAIADKPNLDKYLTIKKNSVAVVTDGTAVLGLGNIGPQASMPVMEGKAMLFKQLADVDAYPIAIDAQGKTVDEIVECVKMIAPGFGGINLEDISAPRCFEIEEKLQKAIDIPVFHDDQHGTAIVTTAALINALKITGKKAEDLKVVFSGVGAAGVACTKMMLDIGVKNIIGCDRAGAIFKGRSANMNSIKESYAEYTNPNLEKGSLSQILEGADMFVGLSGPNLIGEEELKTMAKDPIVFAMSNPIPEVDPIMAKKYCKIIATGRSDFPNQINNVLGFPGVFRGLLDSNAYTVTENMKVAAAQAIADCVTDSELNPDYIIPDAFNPNVAKVVAEAVARVAKEEKVCKEVRWGDPEMKAFVTGAKQTVEA